MNQQQSVEESGETEYETDSGSGETEYETETETEGTAQEGTYEESTDPNASYEESTDPNGTHTVSQEGTDGEEEFTYETSSDEETVSDEKRITIDGDNIGFSSNSKVFHSGQELSQSQQQQNGVDFGDVDPEDKLRNTPRQEQFKQMAGIYDQVDDKDKTYIVNPNEKDYRKAPPNENKFINNMAAGIDDNRPRGLDALKRDEPVSSPKKVAQVIDGNANIAEDVMMNDLKTKQNNGENLVSPQKQPMNVVRRGQHAGTVVPGNPRILQKNNSMAVNNQPPPAWEMGNNAGKQPSFNKAHDHNLVNKTHADDKPVGKSRQEVYKNQKTAKKEFDNYTTHKGVNNNMPPKRNILGGGKVRRRGEYESNSITTLDDDRFDPRSRDEIRRDIESLLKNNFRIKSDNQRKKSKSFTHLLSQI